MITPSLPSLFLWLLTMFLLQKKVRKNRFFTSLLPLFFLFGSLLTVLFFLPPMGPFVAKWIESLMKNMSIPLLGILFLRLIEEIFSCTLLNSKDWRAIWFSGASFSLFLYPAALGLGPLDPYSWGWGYGSFFIAIALLTAILLITKNRFSILLLLTIACFEVQLEPSKNFWDYLLDPIYGTLALMMSLYSLFNDDSSGQEEKGRTCLLRSANLDGRDKEQCFPTSLLLFLER